MVEQSSAVRASHLATSAALPMEIDSGAESDSSDSASFSSGGVSNFSDPDDSRKANPNANSDSESCAEVEKVKKDAEKQRYHAPVPFKQGDFISNITNDITLPVRKILHYFNVFA
jgi:LysM repeat protein